MSSGRTPLTATQIDASSSLCECCWVVTRTTRDGWLVRFIGVNFRIIINAFLFIFFPSFTTCTVAAITLTSVVKLQGVFRIVLKHFHFQHTLDVALQRPKCLFPDLIVWYFLMGARFLFNTFLMHVSHQDKMISSSSYISKPIQRRLRGALLSWRYIGTWGWTVWGKWRKGKKSRCSEKSSSEKSSVESQKGHVVAHGHAVALEGRACAWACASLREACARFCPWFAKIICSPVSGTCLAEQSKPCANLAQTLRCLAVLLHLVGGPLLKENVKHANGTQMSRWSFFACYTFLESAHILLLHRKSAGLSCCRVWVNSKVE